MTGVQTCALPIYKMNYSPKQGVKSHGLPHDPFKSSTVPRPIGWISTVSKEGKDNLAPYSQYQNLTWDPPMVMFAANQSVLGDHERKDTVKNAEETGWFVWNMATYDLREAVNLSSKALPPEDDEFDFAGVTKESCIEAPGSRVKESPVHFECEYVQTVRIPTGDPVSTVDIVIGRVAQVHIDDTRSEEHTSELQSPNCISYAVFCLKKKQTKNK